MVKNSLVLAFLVAACSSNQAVTPTPPAEPEQPPASKLTCPEIASCFAACLGDPVCWARCRDSSSPTSFRKFEDTVLCGQAYNCDTAECLIQHCNNELTACRLDGECSDNSCPIR